MYVCEEVAGGGERNHSTVRAHRSVPCPGHKRSQGMGAMRIVVSRRPAEMRGEKEIKTSGESDATGA